MGKLFYLALLFVPLLAFCQAVNYDRLTTNQLQAEAATLSSNITDYMQDWRAHVHDSNLSRDELEDHATSDDERQRIESEHLRNVVELNRLYTAKGKDLFVRAEKMRVVLIKQALTKKRPFHTVTRITDRTTDSLDAASKRLSIVGPSDSTDKDPERIAAYLLALSK